MNESSDQTNRYKKFKVQKFKQVQEYKKFDLKWKKNRTDYVMDIKFKRLMF